MIRTTTIVFLWMGILFASCDPSMVYHRYKTNDEGSWAWNDPGVFDMEIGDTLSLHHIFLQVRHTTDYPLSNLFMFVTLQGPSGQQARDTVEMILAGPGGEWTGRGTGKLRELRLLYRQNIRFNEAGTYRITLEQAMRRSPLPVTDVGVRVERVNR